MNVRQETLAGDDAGGLLDRDQERLKDSAAQAPMVDGLSEEESAQFLEMQRNSGPNAQIDDSAGTDNEGGLVNTDVNAQAEAAARAAVATDGQQQAAKPGQQQAPAGDDDDDDGADPTQGGKFPQRVNYNKFVRARTRAETAEKDALTLREQLARTDERYKLIVEALKAPGAAAAAPTVDQQEWNPQTLAELGPAPDREKDIFAWSKWQEKRSDLLEQELTKLGTGVQASNEETTLQKNYAADIQKFSTTATDFPKAYEFMMATRVAELAAQQFGIDLYEEGSQLSTEQLDRISQIVVNEEKQLAKIAFQNKQSPAKQLYIMAKARGYRPAAAAPAPGQQQQQPGQKPTASSQLPAGGQQQQARSPVGEAVAAARRGVETNLSLSTGGGAPEGQLTSQQVMTMDDKDFAHFLETASPEQLRGIFGN